MRTHTNVFANDGFGRCLELMNPMGCAVEGLQWKIAFVSSHLPIPIRIGPRTGGSLYIIASAQMCDSCWEYLQWRVELIPLHDLMELWDVYCRWRSPDLSLHIDQCVRIVMIHRTDLVWPTNQKECQSLYI